MVLSSSFLLGKLEKNYPRVNVCLDGMRCMSCPLILVHWFCLLVYWFCLHIYGSTNAQLPVLLGYLSYLISPTYPLLSYLRSLFYILLVSVLYNARIIIMSMIRMIILTAKATQKLFGKKICETIRNCESDLFSWA